MKVLLDHNVSEHLVKILAEHHAETAKYLDWGTLRNGELIASAEVADISVMVTADQNLAYQQNNNKRRLSLVVLNTNKLALILDKISLLRDACQSGGGFI